jgi:hypothetical protein
MGSIKRTRRREVLYTDEEIIPWFVQVAKGYPFKEAAERAGLDPDKMEDTYYSDDDIVGHGLDLSVYAGARIREGTMSVPNRKDGLYDDWR